MILRWMVLFGTLFGFVLLSSCSGEIVNPYADTDGDADTDSDADSDTDGDADGTGDSGGCPGGCPPNQVCHNGACVDRCSGVGSCTAPYECCNNVCVNVRDDPQNCGGCGRDCGSTADSCLAQNCSCNGAVACSAPYHCCGTSGCVDVLVSAEHCGGCNRPCAGTCANGACDQCTPDEHEASGGDSCPDAEDIGTLQEDGSLHVFRGNIYPEGDRDCFKFIAVDELDAQCDSFHVDIRLLTNPDNQFALEVFYGSCQAPECSSRSYSWYSWATDFFEAGADPSGECPCQTPESQDGTSVCSDNTAVYRFCVVRASGDPGDCAEYEVEVSNAAYSTGG